MLPNTPHPDLDLYIDDWTMMRDCAAGERRIKEQAETYLPKPSGFAAQPDQGSAMYDAYKMRAQFPDIFTPTLQGMVGVIHRVDAQIDGLEDGKPLSSFWEKATLDGLTLEEFHRQITAEILQMGRYVILTDVPEDGGTNALPYFVGYGTESLINWSAHARNMFVLDESSKVQNADNEFAWVDEQKFRVLRLAEETYTAQVYKVNDDGEVITPQVRGGKQLTEIPLVVVGPRDLSLLKIEQPPLIGVARSSLAIYRLDADYRHQLFHSGQETLFISAEIDTVPKVVGSGVTVLLPQGGEAKYVGATGAGINAHRIAMQDERQAAVAAGVRLFDTKSQAESGEALRLRGAAQTATLTTIAQASAAALEKSLRYAAQFVGQDPNEIVVKPNLKFTDTTMTPDEAAKLVTVWQSGAIAHETLYEDLQRGEIANQERTFEEEKALIDQEAIDNPQNVGLGGGAGGFGGGGPGQTPPGGLPSRFIETGDGLNVTPGAGA